MKRILSANEMREADMTTIQGGIPALVLMERAALAVVDEICKRDFDLSNICIICGQGNNGGDGVAIARILAERGVDSEILLLGKKEKFTDQLNAQLKMAELYDVRYIESYESGKYSLVIDAMFGVGLTRGIQGGFTDIIEMVNRDATDVVAVDIASGIDATTGQIMNTAIKADLTVTFECAKLGHILYPGVDYTGELVVRDVGIKVDKKAGFSAAEEEKTEYIYRIENADLNKIPKRAQSGNKSTFGKVLIIAGSDDICGAAYFSAAAALRTGVGMVRIFTHKNNRTPLNILLPEALIDVYDENDINENGLRNAIGWSDLVIAGPGFGKNETSRAILELFVKINDRTCIFDADALNIFSENESLWENVNFKAVITPHVGEMSRLVGLSAAEIKRDPIGTASSFCKSHKSICILKNAKTIVAYPHGSCYIIDSGCSALATAGSGDVLTGIVGGFILKCRGTELPAEALGAYFHGKTGCIAAKSSSESSVIASDIVKAINI